MHPSYNTCVREKFGPLLQRVHVYIPRNRSFYSSRHWMARQCPLGVANELGCVPLTSTKLNVSDLLGTNKNIDSY